MAYAIAGVDYLNNLIKQVAERAGREVASVHCATYWDSADDNQSVAFSLTDGDGNRMSGSVPGDWRLLSSHEIEAKLIEKYPLAFAPAVRPTPAGAPDYTQIRQKLTSLRDEINRLLEQTKEWK